MIDSMLKKIKKFLAKWINSTESKKKTPKHQMNVHITFGMELSKLHLKMLI